MIMKRKARARYFPVIFLIGFTIFLNLSIVTAQAPPLPVNDPTGAESVHRDQIYDRFRIERQIEQSRVTPARPQITTPQPDPIDWNEKSKQKAFKLNTVIFDPEPKSITSFELQEITQKYTLRDGVSLFDIYTMLTEIDTLFDKKHIVARAVLPVQDVDSGVLHVKIIEAQLGKTIIETKRPAYPFFEHAKSDFVPACDFFSKKFVKKQFSFTAKNGLNIKNLEDELLRFNRRFRSQLVAELEPGDEHGLSNLKLTLVKPQPISATYFIDNSGRKNSGTIRNGFYTQLQGLLGLDDSFFVSYDETQGTSMLVLSGGLPINTKGTSFDLSYDYGTPRTIDGPFAVLGIHGISQRIRPSFRQQIVNKKRQNLDAFLAVETYRSKTWFDQELNYAEKLTSITVGLDYQLRFDKSAIYASLSITSGNVGIADYLSSYQYHDFCLLRASLLRVYNLTKKYTFIVRGNGHAALTDLPQSQIFQIGGMSTVRGVEEGLMSGDSGYLISLEGRYKFGRHNKEQKCTDSRKSQILQPRFEGFVFFDHGGVFYRDSPPSLRSSDFIFSIGIGGNLNIGKYTSITGGVGQPLFTKLSHQSAFRESLNTPRGYFTAKITF
jgi:hemolysin activation/secretion protein